MKPGAEPIRVDEPRANPMGKGNNPQGKEKKKPKKAAESKPVPVKAVTPPPKKP